ncbi:MAG: iron uptake system protein EfeO [Mycobacterium sp.]
MTVRRGWARGSTAMAVAGVLLLSACSSDGGSTGDGDTADEQIQVVTVQLTEEGCSPTTAEAVAGPTTFEAQTDRTDEPELEILDGDRLLGEVANLAPSITGTFSITLEPGTYDMRCGQHSDPVTGTLTVTGEGDTGSDEADEEAVETYRAFALGETKVLIARTQEFADAVIAGDIEGAKDLFAYAREPYERIEPIAEAFGDLDPAIDAREGDVPEAKWTGFHRIEKALWVDEDLSGMAPIAKKLVADVRLLQELTRQVDLEPAQVANGASELLGEVANSKITGEEDRYSHTDLWDFEANVEGSKAAFDAVKPLIPADQEALIAEIEAGFVDAIAVLDPYRKGDGFVLYTDLTDKDTTVLAQTIDTLAEPLSQVAAIVVAP